MADRTQQMTITPTWTEFTAPLGMVNGTTYIVDVVGVSSRAQVFTADTDTADAPADEVIGHPWHPPTDRAREYPKESGVFTWVRVSRGEAILIATPLA